MNINREHQVELS